MKLQPISRFGLNLRQNYMTNSVLTTQDGQKYDTFVSSGKQNINFTSKVASLNKLTAKIAKEKFNPDFLPKTESSAVEYIKKFPNLILNEDSDARRFDCLMKISKIIKGVERKIHQYYFSLGNLVMSESFYPITSKAKKTFRLRDGGSLESIMFRRKNYKEIPMFERLRTKQAPWILRIEHYRTDETLKSIYKYNTEGKIAKIIKCDKKGNPIRKKA